MQEASRGYAFTSDQHELPATSSQSSYSSVSSESSAAPLAIRSHESAHAAQISAQCTMRSSPEIERHASSHARQSSAHAAHVTT